MLIPAGYRTYNKPCGTVDGCRCPRCGQMAGFTKFRYKTTGTVLFVPVASVTHAAFVRCSACGAAYEVSKKNLKDIRTGADVLNAIQEHRKDRQGQQEALREKYSVGFSEKKQTVAVWLALLLTTYGAPFFYIGKPLWGVLCLLVSLISVSMMWFPLLFVMVCFGFVLAFQIGQGKVKDKHGKYIVSQRQRELFSK